MLGYISIQDDFQTMLKAYKYRIYPNLEQQVLIEKHFGCSRFVFNWALALQKRYYAMFGKSLSRSKIQSHLVKKKKKAKRRMVKKSKK